MWVKRINTKQAAIGRSLAIHPCVWTLLSFYENWVWDYLEALGITDKRLRNAYCQPSGQAVLSYNNSHLALEST